MGSFSKAWHRNGREVLFLSQAHATCTLGFTLPSVQSAEPQNDAVVSLSIGNHGQMNQRQLRMYSAKKDQHLLYNKFPIFSHVFHICLFASLHDFKQLHIAVMGGQRSLRAHPVCAHQRKVLRGEWHVTGPISPEDMKKTMVQEKEKHTISEMAQFWSLGLNLPSSDDPR